MMGSRQRIQFALPPLGVVLIAGLSVIFGSISKTNTSIASIENNVAPLLRQAEEQEIELSIESKGLDHESILATNENTLFLAARHPWIPSNEIDEPPEIEKLELEPAIDEESSQEIINDPPQIQLFGVLINGSQPKALIFDLETGEEAWVTVGHIYKTSWIVAEIQPKMVKLQENDRELIVLFSE